MEVGNLNNRVERLNILRAATRQRISRALTDALDKLRADRKRESAGAMVVKKGG